MVAHVRVPAAEAELAADALFAGGASAVEERAGGDGTVTLIGDGDPGPVPAHWEVREVPVIDDGLDAWRPHARAWRAGRVVVQPPWAAPLGDPRDDDVVVLIDPGRAFGSGSHPSTRGMLVALAGLVPPARSVLDVGCGSGVLAVAAARLGAARVVGVDVDPAAREATAANAVRNEAGVEVAGAEVGAAHGPFDVAVANIGASTLIELAPALGRLAPVLVLGGVLEEDVARVVAAYRTPLGAVAVEEGWATIVLAAPTISA